MSILENLLKRKVHVKKVADETKARQLALETERTEAKGRLWTLGQERDRLKQTIFDEKARALLDEDRHPIEQEIERLRLRQPIVEAEILELAQELIPRLENHAKEAEQEVKAEALKLKREAAVHATEGREALLRQWNISTAELLRVAEAIGKFNGRYEAHQTAYRSLAEFMRLPMQATGDAIPVALLGGLRAAAAEAWKRGYQAGEGLANEEEIHL